MEVPEIPVSDILLLIGAFPGSKISGPKTRITHTNRGRAFAFALHCKLSECSVIAKDLTSGAGWDEWLSGWGGRGDDHAVCEGNSLDEHRTLITLLFNLIATEPCRTK